ncbi:GNAT family N-acetyltransferase [Tianweitania populi]|uniref:N-acetyltransferase domain-containing protein n=1 Tax=Tianweitania populi TaxID=1607949 RepID=A0A8J3DRK9_9HYPH|nr:GNAT family N-acetyltransferase [Tianweitania populi]GHD18202.1 hypothetical protein GCM10016234_28250 [Tianweitania populi]
MTQMPTTDIAPLQFRDASELAPLLAAYAQALTRGAPRRPDSYYAEMLLQDRSAEVLGARIDDRLIGFMIFTDLPEPVSGMRYGMADHIFVDQDFRGQGIAKAMVDVLADFGHERGWRYLILNAPRQPEDGRKLYEQVAAPADWTSYVIDFSAR